MQRPDELGQLKAGFLADVVLIDGDPLEDLSLLTDPAKVQLVMKDGVIHKDCATPVPRQAALHLEGADAPLQEQGIKEALAEMH
jgi:cytosine/adenosine deaminase-related metal-dependent hydrolase